MNFKSIVLTTSALMVSFSAQAGDIKSVLPEIKQMASNPAVVSAVKQANSKGTSLDSIKAMDDKWKAASGNIPEAQEMMTNEAATALKTAEASNTAMKESILTDNQGANVAISALTSDYWQGDEAKFVKAFAGGSGKDYIARPKRDDSTGTIISQVSVPVMDGGKAIGTLTVGVDIKAIP